MRRGTRIVALLVVALVVGACSSGSSPATNVREAGPFSFARFVGATDPAAPVEFSVVLRMPGQRDLHRYLRELYDPGSPSFHRFLAARAFGRRFGLPAGEIRRAERALEAAGLRVVHEYPQRTALDVRGTAASIGSLFGVSMGDFRDHTGRLFHAPLSEPVIPFSLRDAVAAVSGLNGAPVPARPDSVSSKGLMPADLEAAYDIGPLHRAGMDGHGLSIAIISFASFREQDVAEFDRLTGTAGPPPEEVPVNGGSTELIGSGSGEVNLDIDVVRSVAPKAQILNYSADSRTVRSFLEGTADIVDRIVQDGRADIASMSWGLCDVTNLGDGTPWISPADRLRAARAFDAAVAAGISIFHSSGDAGAYQCERNDPEDHRLTTEWPADLPQVISVGGTNLSVRKDGTYLQEAGWEDILEHGGTGGGLNPVDPRPPWQTGPGVSNRFSNGKRQFPDVAAAGDPDSGYFTVSPNSQSGASEPGVSGGTSASSPFWAAAMLLIEQYAKQHGVTKLGYVNPMLYSIAAHQNPSVPSFHDVTIGGNRYYDCAPGWDYATGLGSPDVFNLARAVVDYVKGHAPGA